MVKLVERYYCGRCFIWHRVGVTRQKLFDNHLKYEITELRPRIIPDEDIPQALKNAGF